MKKIFILTQICFIVLVCISCTATKQYSKLKADFIGFSDDVTTSYLDSKIFKDNSVYQSSIRGKWQKVPLNLLTESGANKLNNNIYSLRQGTNTCAMYAYDMALDRIEYVQKNCMTKDPNSKYYIVMLTDGLDNNSPALGDDRNRISDMSDELYKKKIEKRKADIMKKYSFFNMFKSKSTTNEFYSYILMYKGEDIEASGYREDELISRLRVYSGAQNTSFVPEPIMAESIDELLEKFKNEIISRSFSFNIQKSKAGQYVKMFLSYDKSIFFQCKLERKKGLCKDKYKLVGMTKSHGLDFDLDEEYTEDVTNLIFTLKNVTLNKVPLKINNYDVEQRITDGGIFRYNSEYTSTSGNMKNAYIIMILDGSKSFKQKFVKAQGAAVSIVEMLTEL